MKHIHFSGLSFRVKTGVWLLFVLLFLGVLTLTTLSYFSPAPNGLIGLFVQFHFEAMALIGLLGIGLGATSFYVLGKELEKKEATTQNQAQLLLSFLNPLEKQCVLFLVNNNGECFQSDFAKLPGMTRLKAHRIGGKLHERKIIQVSTHGKANLISLSPEWKKGLAGMT